MKRKAAARKTPAPKKRPVKRVQKVVPVKAKKPATTARKRTPVAAAAPRTRRAIFIDVENTSSEHSLLAVLDHLQIDRTAQPTEVVAAGNWKSVGSKVGRTLAALGAQLVHSAPATGVRDWSDLWIAVAAGRWIALAAPGDTIEIVSDDRAFDAVGDAAAATGITFHRISYRAIPGAAHPVVAVPAAAPAARPRRRRGGRRHHGSAAASAPAHTPATPAHSTAAPHRPPAAVVSSSAHDEAQAASLEHIRAALTRLSGGTGRWINLDTIANSLREEGFTRPPGSPRLVTRLRALKDVEVTASGMVRFTSEVSPTAEGPSAPEPSAPRRPRRRGGRGRRRGTAAPTATPSAAPEGDAPA